MAGGGSAASGVGERAATLGGRRSLAGQGQAAARRRGRAAVWPREAGGQRSRAAGNKQVIGPGALVVHAQVLMEAKMLQ
uniref:Uncharacterized protein n=1 Tax=Oryza nivara TaxID=4536 RepID=A0A0E0J0R4_ORYNI